MSSRGRGRRSRDTPSRPLSVPPPAVTIEGPSELAARSLAVLRRFEVKRSPSARPRTDAGEPSGHVPLAALPDHATSTRASETDEVDNAPEPGDADRLAMHSLVASEVRREVDAVRNKELVRVGGLILALFATAALGIWALVSEFEEKVNARYRQQMSDFRQDFREQLHAIEGRVEALQAADRLRAESARK